MSLKGPKRVLGVFSGVPSVPKMSPKPTSPRPPQACLWGVHPVPNPPPDSPLPFFFPKSPAQINFIGIWGILGGSGELLGDSGGGSGEPRGPHIWSGDSREDNGAAFGWNLGRLEAVLGLLGEDSGFFGESLNWGGVSACSGSWGAPGGSPERDLGPQN